MEILDTVSRVVHISTAIVLVGGSVFTLLVLMPAAKQLPDEPHGQLAEAITGRWKRFVHIGVSLFIISGVYNYVRALPNHQGDALYHALLGVKMLLALGVFFLAAALVGRSTKLELIRRNRCTWLTVLVFLAAVIVAISGYVKVRGIPTPGPTAGQNGTIEGLSSPTDSDSERRWASAAWSSRQLTARVEGVSGAGQESCHA